MPPRGAVAAPAPGGAGGQNQGQAQQGGGFLGGLVRMAVMWYLFNMFKGPQGGGGPGADAVVKPHFARGDLLDVRVLASERPALESLADGQLLWRVDGVPVGTTPEHKVSLNFTLSKAAQRNGTVWLHTVFTVAGAAPEERDQLPPGSVFTRSAPLVRYLPKPKNKTGVNLLAADGAPMTTPKAEPEEGPVPWVSFWKPNMTISLVDHFNTYTRSAVPPQLRPFFEFADPDAEQYLPIIYYDEFWLLRDKLIPLNDSIAEVPLHLVLKTGNIWWMQLQQQMEQSFSMQINMGVANEGESDEIKRIFLEGNPVLLAITMVVSLLHSVFDFMAFKNDVAFWKENRSMEGLSARSIMINAVCQLIILLYLFDNETSTVVLISSAVGTAIEFWKVTKAFDVSIGDSFPYLSIKDKASYMDSRHNTNKHDAEAMRYLSYALYPCVIGYSVYTLMYDTHKSWYSWVLGSLVGAVYTFGFILMCPQLYLNYKLKSVAHLPWRQMTYKFLNTIIDDLFAFVIKMPALHRLSVFRDDVVFMVFLYQRWIYRVDKSRVNEFGFSGEMEEERARRIGTDAAAAGGSGDADAGSGALVALAGGGSDGAVVGGARRRKAAAHAGDGGGGGGDAAADGGGEPAAAAAAGGGVASRKDE